MLLSEFHGSNEIAHLTFDSTLPLFDAFVIRFKSKMNHCNGLNNLSFEFNCLREFYYSLLPRSVYNMN